MRRLIAAIGALALAACTESSETPFSPDTRSFSNNAAGVVRVVNSNDAGPGSFRQAVQDANADGSIRRIDFDKGLQPIALQSPVVFTGPQSLDIDGSGAELVGSAIPAGAAFTANGGGDLKVSTLTITDAPARG